MTIDSLYLAQQIHQFQLNLAVLQKSLDAAQPILEQMKEALAIQWVLGNILIGALFVIGLKAYFFAEKALKAFDSARKYVLPKRWLMIYIVFFAAGLVVFNLFPRWTYIDVKKMDHSYYHTVK